VGGAKWLAGLQSASIALPDALLSLPLHLSFTPATKKEMSTKVQINTHAARRTLVAAAAPKLHSCHQKKK
jgi:hypothetical protein